MASDLWSTLYSNSENTVIPLCSSVFMESIFIDMFQYKLYQK
jgi:hypothetical protein